MIDRHAYITNRLVSKGCIAMKLVLRHLQHVFFAKTPSNNVLKPGS